MKNLNVAPSEQKLEVSKKDTNDTRESAAIYVAEHLIEDGAEIHVYDTKVSETQVVADLQYLWELKGINEAQIAKKLQ